MGLPAGDNVGEHDGRVGGVVPREELVGAEGPDALYGLGLGGRAREVALEPRDELQPTHLRREAQACSERGRGRDGGDLRRGLFGVDALCDDGRRDLFGAHPREEVLRRPHAPRVGEREIGAAGEALHAPCLVGAMSNHR